MNFQSAFVVVVGAGDEVWRAQDVMLTQVVPVFTTVVRAFTLTAAVSLMAVLPARAGAQLEPGLWQDVETSKDGGKVTKPNVRTTCLSPEEARDPIKTMLKDSEGQKCEKYDVKETGNTMTVEIKCDDPKGTRMEFGITVNFITRRHYSATMKSMVIFKGIKSASQVAIDSTWLSASCNKQ